MTDIKYVAFDVHLATISAAVVDLSGKLITQAVFRTDASAIRDFLRGISGKLHLTFEEGTLAQWLFDLARPLVCELIVCNPRENHSMKRGNKSDQKDALQLATLLRAGLLKSVYHNSPQMQTLKHLVHNYDSLTEDARLKAAFKGAALEALKTEAFKKMYERLRASGVGVEMARLTIARKLAAVALAIWKSGQAYDETKLSNLPG
jgi:hypothetical protein